LILSESNDRSWWPTWLVGPGLHNSVEMSSRLQSRLDCFVHGVPKLLAVCVAEFAGNFWMKWNSNFTSRLMDLHNKSYNFLTKACSPLRKLSLPTKCCVMRITAAPALTNQLACKPHCFVRVRVMTLNDWITGRTMNVKCISFQKFKCQILNFKKFQIKNKYKF
jgi:hypothetical protein